MRRIEVVIAAMLTLVAVSDAMACAGPRTIVVVDRSSGASRASADVLVNGLKQVIGSTSTVGQLDLVALGDGTSHREIGSDCLQTVPDVAAVAVQAEKDRQAALQPWERAGEAISGKNVVVSRPFEKRVEDARRARDTEVARRAKLAKLALDEFTGQPPKDGPYLLASIAVLVRERCQQESCRVLLFSSLIDSRSSFAMSPDMNRPADLAKDHAGYVRRNFGPLRYPAKLEIQVWGFGRTRDGSADLEPHNRGKLTEYWKAAVAETMKASLTLSSRL